MVQNTRGVRNNNPGNIDRNATKWQGMAADQSSDSRFIVFTAPEWGIRAIARLLMTYQDRYKLNTVRKIINRWAPPVENDTGAYVSAVAASVGVDPDAVVDVDQASVMLPMVKAIIIHENGRNPYTDSVIMDGIRRAGVSDAKPPPLVKQNTFIAQAGAGASIGLATVAQYAPQAKSAADQLAAYTGAPIIAHAATILLTVAGLCVLAGIVSQVLKQRAAS